MCLNYARHVAKTKRQEYKRKKCALTKSIEDKPRVETTSAVIEKCSGTVKKNAYVHRRPPPIVCDSISVRSKKNVNVNRAIFDVFDVGFDLPSRSGGTTNDLFLYTLNEREKLTNKMFTVRQKLNKQLSASSQLSKSDTNLSSINN